MASVCSARPCMRPSALTTPTETLTRSASIGAADGDRPVAGADLVDRRRLGHGQRLVGVDLQQHEHAVGVAADDLRGPLLAVGQPHEDRRRLLGEVERAGDDVAVGGDDQARRRALGERLAVDRSSPPTVRICTTESATASTGGVERLLLERRPSRRRLRWRQQPARRKRAEATQVASAEVAERWQRAADRTCVLALSTSADSAISSICGVCVDSSTRLDRPRHRSHSASVRLRPRTASASTSSPSRSTEMRTSSNFRGARSASTTATHEAVGSPSTNTTRSSGRRPARRRRSWGRPRRCTAACAAARRAPARCRGRRATAARPARPVDSSAASIDSPGAQSSRRRRRISSTGSA